MVSQAVRAALTNLTDGGSGSVTDGRQSWHIALEAACQDHGAHVARMAFLPPGFGQPASAVSSRGRESSPGSPL